MACLFSISSFLFFPRSLILLFAFIKLWVDASVSATSNTSRDSIRGVIVHEDDSRKGHLQDARSGIRNGPAWSLFSFKFLLLELQHQLIIFLFEPFNVHRGLLEFAKVSQRSQNGLRSVTVN